MPRLLSLTASALVLLALAAPFAGADRVYHTEHLALTPVGGAPLRSGFVQNIKANGPIVYAHEIYKLTGATPLATYTVTNNFFIGDTSCKKKGTPLRVRHRVVPDQSSGQRRGRREDRARGHRRPHRRPGRVLDASERGRRGRLPDRLHDRDARLSRS